METIDYSKLIQDMIAAAKEKLNNQWNNVKPYAEKEFKSYADNVKMIVQMKLDGTINEEQARLQMTIQKNSITIVLLTIEGLGIIAVEQAINAAISVVKDTINTAIGWTIL
jgi:hypothetical protein